MISILMLIEDLPDEIIEHILTFVEERDLGRCRQVNQRLYHIANSPYIVTLFPHISLDGSLYLKEQAYFTPTLRDRILSTTEANDLEWLVSRTTQIFKEVYKDSSRSNIASWIIILCTAHTVCESAATDLFYSVVDLNSPYTPYWDEGVWAVAKDALHVLYDDDDNNLNLSFAILEETNSIPYEMHIQLATFTDKVWSVSSDIIQSITDDFVYNINIITDLKQKNLHTRFDTYSGPKCYQVNECMMLLAINKTLILSIKDIVSRPRTAPLPKAYSHILEKPLFLPKHVLENLKDNPWIKQYMELFQIKNDCYPEE